MAELGKYAVYPTVEYTGVIPISIPLFEISLHGKTLPFGLSYHASGIKVSQQETEVGLGWSLSGLHTISRSIIGGPDERYTSASYSGVYHHNPKTEQEIYDAAFLPVVPNNQGTIIEKKRYLSAIADGNDDNQSDVYTFSTKSRSGKFLVRNMNEYVTMPTSSVKISRGTIRGDTYNSYPFTVVDEEGLSYLFDEISYAIGDDFMSGMTGNINVNAWYISRITDNESGQYADFTYESDWIREYTTYEEYKVGYEFNGEGISYVNPPLTKQSSFIDQNNKILTAINHSGGRVEFGYIIGPNPPLGTRKFLNAIRLFNANGELVRLIELTYDTGTDRVKLSTVKVKSTADPATAQVYAMAYNPQALPAKNSYSVDYWGYFNAAANITFIPRDTIGPGQFPAYMVGEPHVITVGSADRSPDPAFTQAEMLRRITYPTGGYTDFEFENNRYVGKAKAFTNHSFTAAAMGLGIGVKSESVQTFSYNASDAVSGNDKVTLNIRFNPPTPPFTDFADRPQLVTVKNLTTNTVIATRWHDSDPSQPLNVTQDLVLAPGDAYELKVVVYGVAVPQSYGFSTNTEASVTWRSMSLVDQEKVGGGLRAKEVRHYTAAGSPASREVYRYGRDESGIGQAIFEEPIFHKNYHDQEYYTFYEVPGGPGFVTASKRADWWERKYFGLTAYSSVAASGASIAYDQVRKYQYDSPTPGYLLSESIYSIRKDVSFWNEHILNSQNYGAMSHLFEDPLLKRRTRFKYREGLAYPLQQETFAYTPGGIIYAVPAVIEKRKHIWTMILLQGPFFPSDFYLDYRLGGFSFYGSLRKPLEHRTVDYFHNADYSDMDSLVRTQTYEYNAVYADQPTKITTTGSDGVNSVVDFLYPDDIGNFSTFGVTLSTEEQQGINGLKKDGLHLPVSPIRVSEYKGTTLVKHSFNISKKFGQKIHPSRSLEMVNGIVSTNVEVFSYDTWGNPLEAAKRDGPRTAYLWGYGSQYPIAEIRNATRATVVSALGGITAVNNFGAQASPTETAVGNFLAPLRTAATLKQAQSTTFTYKPLVGMSSSTDASGRTTWFDYDGLGRLWRTRDHFGNVIEEYKYNYRP